MVRMAPGDTAFFMSSVDVDTVQNHLQSILKKLEVDHPKSGESSTWRPVVISCRRQLVGFNSVYGLPQYLVSLCRQYNLLKNDRITLLSYMDQLITLQLGLAEKNKQERGDFDIESSIVIQAGKDIVNRKLQKSDAVGTNADDVYEDYQKMLQGCNCLDLCDVINIVKEECERNEEMKKEIQNSVYIFLDVPKQVAERNGLEFLCEGRQLREVLAEIPLNCTGDDITLNYTDITLDNMLQTRTTASTVKKPLSMTEAFVRQVYLSYLELLINSRSELALARVINVPERDLSHTAFTDIRHEATVKNMPMYQTAVSFLMKIRLGGKGYAPDADCKMAPHVKGIGEFVDLMHRMETVIEEDPDIRSGCQRAVNIIKKQMLKCRDSKIRPTSVEAVSDQLQSQISCVIDNIEAMVAHSPDKPSCNGGSLTGRKTRRALRYLLDKLTTLDDDLSTLDHLCDVYSSQRTPIRFQSLLSQFRSPDDEDLDEAEDEELNTTLAERMMKKNLLPPTPVYAKRYKSDMDWADPVHNVGFNESDDVFAGSQVIVIPSKTVVHAGSKSVAASKVLESILDQENVTDQEPLPVVTTNQQSTRETSSKPEGQKVSKKRPLQSAPSSQPEKKKKLTAPSKTCRRKLLPQVKGQQQLTSFFRV